MIVVKLSGGLGNQMLQYSFALLLRHFKKEVELDISLYQYINEHNGPTESGGWSATRLLRTGINAYRSCRRGR